MRTCLLLLFPLALHAGWIDWLFPPQPQMAEQFECPHHCGSWGYEPMQNVEWHAVLALYEVDRMGHACLDVPFPFPDTPESWEDPWYKHVLENKITLFAPLKEVSVNACRSTHTTLRTYPNCFCYPREIHPSFHWEIIPTFRRPDKRGLKFYLSFDSRGDDEDDELPTVYENYSFLNVFYSFSDLELFSHLVTENIEDYFIRHVQWHCSLDSSGCIASPPVRLSSIASILQKDIEYYQKKIDTLTQTIHSAPTNLNTYSEEKEVERLDGYKKSIEKDAEEVDGEIERWLEEGRRYNLILKTHLPLIKNHIHAMFDAYTAIYDHCISVHEAPSAYFNRAEMRFAFGNDIGCLEDIKQLFRITPSELITEEVSKKLNYTKGVAESETGLFHEAILTLSEYITSHPNHKEAYIERAISHLESGDIHSAFDDFVTSGLRGTPIPSSWKDDLDFACGLIKGISKDGLDALLNAGPAIYSSLSGLSHGLWAFATSPEQTSRDFCEACKEAMQEIQSGGFDAMIDCITPEFKTLIQKGDKLSYTQQGELIGNLIGRLGVEFILLKGTTKSVKIYRDLRKSNAILSFNRIASSIEVEHALINCHRQWWKNTAPMITELKESGGRIGEKLYKTFKDQPLSELQVRKILHQAGFQTFPRPKGIPNHWSTKLSKNGGGMRYRLEKIDKTGQHLAKIEVRVMPGNPKSSILAEQRPYVKHSIDGKYLDQHGNFVLRDTAEAHILLEEYNFETLNKVTLYE